MLHEACASPDGHDDVIALCDEIKPQDLNLPFYAAVKSGGADTVAFLLLDKQASVKNPNPSAGSIFDLALDNPDQDVFEFLIDQDTLITKLEDGTEAIHLQALKGHPNTINFELPQFITKTQRGRTAAYYIGYLNHENLIKRLKAKLTEDAVSKEINDEMTRGHIQRHYEQYIALEPEQKWDESDVICADLMKLFKSLQVLTDEDLRLKGEIYVAEANQYEEQEKDFKKNLKKAINTVDKIKIKTDDDYRTIANCYLRINKFKDVEKALLAIDQVTNKNNDDKYNLVNESVKLFEYYIDQKQFELANDLAIKTLALFQDSPDLAESFSRDFEAILYFNLSMSYHYLEEFAKKEEALHKTIQLLQAIPDKTHGEWESLATHLESTHQLDEAVKALDEAIKSYEPEEPNEEESDDESDQEEDTDLLSQYKSSRNNIIRKIIVAKDNEARIFLQQGDKVKADQLYMEIIRLCNSLTSVTLSNMVIKAEALNQLNQKEPANLLMATIADQHFNLGTKAVGFRDYKTAETHTLKAIAARQDLEGDESLAALQKYKIQLAFIKDQRNDLIGALQSLQEALAHFTKIKNKKLYASEICDLYFHMAVIYYKLNQPEEALFAHDQTMLMLIEYNDVLNIKPADMHRYNATRDVVLHFLFFTKIEQNKINEAIILYRKINKPSEQCNKVYAKYQPIPAPKLIEAIVSPAKPAKKKKKKKKRIAPEVEEKNSENVQKCKSRVSDLIVIMDKAINALDQWTEIVDDTLSFSRERLSEKRKELFKVIESNQIEECVNDEFENTQNQFMADERRAIEEEIKEILKRKINKYQHKTEGALLKYEANLATLSLLNPRVFKKFKSDCLIETSPPPSESPPVASASPLSPMSTSSSGSPAPSPSPMTLSRAVSPSAPRSAQLKRPVPIRLVTELFAISEVTSGSKNALISACNEMIRLHSHDEEKEGTDPFQSYYKKMLITLNLLNAIKYYKEDLNLKVSKELLQSIRNHIAHDRLRTHKESGIILHSLIEHFRDISQDILSKVSNEPRTFNLAFAAPILLDKFRPFYPDFETCDKALNESSEKEVKTYESYWFPLILKTEDKQVVRMLIAICGELYAQDRNLNFSHEIHTILQNCNKIRNKLNHPPYRVTDATLENTIGLISQFCSKAFDAEKYLNTHQSLIPS